jgi:hypothetical protein
MQENRFRLWMWVISLFSALGIFATLYVVYDLTFPNRFVGDMYGLEVMFRVVLLFAAAAPMAIGVLLLSVGWRKKLRRPVILGAVVILASSSALVWMAVDAGLSRRQNEIVKSYHEKSVAELLAIARDQKDQHALDALMVRADPAAVSGLTLIVLDTNQPGNLRYVAAQALSRIGGEDARAALEKALDSADEAQFRGHLKLMIQGLKSK